MFYYIFFFQNLFFFFFRGVWTVKVLWKSRRSAYLYYGRKTVGTSENTSFVDVFSARCFQIEFLNGKAEKIQFLKKKKKSFPKSKIIFRSRIITTFKVVPIFFIFFFFVRLKFAIMYLITCKSIFKPYRNRKFYSRILFTVKLKINFDETFFFHPSTNLSPSLSTC